MRSWPSGSNDGDPSNVTCVPTCVALKPATGRRFAFLSATPLVSLDSPGAFVGSKFTLSMLAPAALANRNHFSSFSKSPLNVCTPMLLIATPIARVLFSVVAFALQRDRTYVVVTLIVLAVLLYSLIRGRV